VLKVNLFKKLFNKSRREMKRLRPTVDQINAVCATLRDVPDDELRARTTAFRRRIVRGTLPYLASAIAHAVAQHLLEKSAYPNGSGKRARREHLEELKARIAEQLSPEIAISLNEVSDDDMTFKGCAAEEIQSQSTRFRERLARRIAEKVPLRSLSDAEIPEEALKAREGDGDHGSGPATGFALSDGNILVSWSVTREGLIEHLTALLFDGRSAEAVLLRTADEVLRKLSDEELRKGADEAGRRILDEVMVEAYALIKETCRRFKERGMQWDVVGNMTTWDMVPFDVQLIGAIALHRGKITEMATGEGKTLVAIMPLYLNALEARGVHLVTVNDYLARRDASWNGPIYHWLGLSVAVLQDPNANDGIESLRVEWTEEKGYHLVSIPRKEAYGCDITYGRQDQFGFDYLYDNMAWDVNDVRHRGFHYAIVDEADQLLIDEARTPLIISGPVPESKSERYHELRQRVDRLVKEQTTIVAQLVDDGEKLWQEGHHYVAGRKLLQAQRGAPKQRKLMRLKEDGEVQKQIFRVDLDYMRDKRVPELDEDLLYVIEEKNHSAEITEEGRARLLIADEKRRFISLGETALRIQKDRNASDEEKQERLEAEFRKYIDDTKGRGVLSDTAGIVREIESNDVLGDEQKGQLIAQHYRHLVDLAKHRLIPASLDGEISAIKEDTGLVTEQRQTKIAQEFQTHARDAVKKLLYPGAKELADEVQANGYLSDDDKRQLVDDLTNHAAQQGGNGFVDPTLELILGQIARAEELSDEQKESIAGEVFRLHFAEESKKLMLPDLGEMLRQVEKTPIMSGNAKADLVEEMFRSYIEDANRKFILPDLSENLELIRGSAALDDERKRILVEQQYASYADVAERIHGMSNLIRAYGLFERDVSYVVQDDKVIIVDEFTGRLQPGRRYSEGLHQALEAKENVTVERDTQTVATITVQNYFRMYDKLAGMTGTAETEEDELASIYKLEVVVIPTNKPVRRIDLDDVIFRTKREKYNAVVDEIEHLHEQNLPALIGTRSVEVSELLSRMLKRKGIGHSVLNAKYHQKEAEIIAQAGQPGAVTIATNMAGRGTDIKIPRSLVKCMECKLFTKERGTGRFYPDDTPTADVVSDQDLKRSSEEERQRFASLWGWDTGDEARTPTIKDCLEHQPCGLHIVGTERHDARRIDRQLRGRSGRQGDPGASQFFLSLEDDLMRLFGSDRIARIMDRLGAEEGEVIQSPMVTKAIDRAQQRVEGNNFEIRKRLLDYDDVMNQQREVIYDRRRYILEHEEGLEAEIRGLTDAQIAAIVGKHVAESEQSEEGWSLDGIATDASKVFGVEVRLDFDDTEIVTEDLIGERIRKAVYDKYEARTRELRREARRQGAPDDTIFVHRLQKIALLSSIDDRWREHLTDIEDMKGGIHLRAYGQKDPVVEFKREAYDMFERLIAEIDRQALEFVFKPQLPSEREVEKRRREAAQLTAQHAELEAAPDGAVPEVVSAEPQVKTVGRGARKPVTVSRRSVPRAPQQQTKGAIPRVSRNAPCPCGSGKKYKYCHGKNER